MVEYTVEFDIADYGTKAKQTLHGLMYQLAAFNWSLSVEEVGHARYRVRAYGLHNKQALTFVRQAAEHLELS